MRLIEFWPDYGQGPLWSPDGTPVDAASLGLPDDLVQQLSLWNGSDDDVTDRGCGRRRLRTPACHR
ncbi:protein of unknown function [Micropruina glycogenica]|uniref:Uncharacterized protein n=1 Tax=Micropruina glycogenica TaxID=75385 RepID=A0A2N9JIY7_9ACTN|nr:protein of unknown function [Micropruina glycogenica]